MYLPNKNKFTKDHKNIRYKYSLDCEEKTFNREIDSYNWMPWWVDGTALLIGERYCPKEKWSKLPNK